MLRNQLQMKINTILVKYNEWNEMNENLSSLELEIFGGRI